MVADGDSGVEGGWITVIIRHPNGSTFSVQTSLGSTTVRGFKVIVAQNSDISADQQKLIYKGEILNDDQTLESYGLQGEDTVHMLRSLPAIWTTTTTTTTTITTTRIGGAAINYDEWENNLDRILVYARRLLIQVRRIRTTSPPSSRSMSTTLSTSDERNSLRESIGNLYTELQSLMTILNQQAAGLLDSSFDDDEEDDDQLEDNQYTLQLAVEHLEHQMILLLQIYEASL